MQTIMNAIEVEPIPGSATPQLEPSEPKNGQMK